MGAAPPTMLSLFAALTATYNNTEFYVAQTLVLYLGRDEAHFFTGNAPDDQSRHGHRQLQQLLGQAVLDDVESDLPAAPGSMLATSNVSTTFTKADGSGDVSILRPRHFFQNVLVVRHDAAPVVQGARARRPSWCPACAAAAGPEVRRGLRQEELRLDGAGGGLVVAH